MSLILRCLSMGVEPTPYARAQEAGTGRRVALRVLQLETTLPSTPVSSAWLGDGQRRQAIQGRNSMHGYCKGASYVASGESVLCLLLGNRLASDGHAHQRQGERCSTRPFTIRSTVTASLMICRGHAQQAETRAGRCMRFASRESPVHENAARRHLSKLRSPTSAGLLRSSTPHRSKE